MPLGPRQLWKGTQIPLRGFHTSARAYEPISKNHFVARKHHTTQPQSPSLTDKTKLPPLPQSIVSAPFGALYQVRAIKTHPIALPHRAFISLGSNVGDRLGLIEDACRALDAQDGIQICRTSGLWETKPMYVTNQEAFLNGACEIRTSLEPLDLLDTLQGIEKALNRRKTVPKGPRTIDLDILLYDDAVISNDRLTVPHQLMLERAFVLQPLCELIPEEKLPKASGSGTTFATALCKLNQSDLAASTMTPIARDVQPLEALAPTRRTRVMSVLNVTPDSFSDGGLHSDSDLASLERAIQSHLDAGASIIDVGGQSTRPKAKDIGSDEEIKRVVPCIKLIDFMIQRQGLHDRACISIDTYRASVVRAAVQAGADVVNDVSAGALDPAMLATVAELGCSFMLMHMRGDPSTMATKENRAYPGDLIETIGAELCMRVQAAEIAGIRRWRMILDPGIGFAKTGAQNLEVLRRFGELRAFKGLEGIPWMIGTSRKGFIGTVTGVKEPRERVWGTAAAVTAAVQGGIDIVRVHDVLEMSQVVKMADALWRH